MRTRKQARLIAKVTAESSSPNGNGTAASRQNICETVDLTNPNPFPCDVIVKIEPEDVDIDNTGENGNAITEDIEYSEINLKEEVMTHLTSDDLEGFVVVKKQKRKNRARESSNTESSKRESSNRDKTYPKNKKQKFILFVGSGDLDGFIVVEKVPGVADRPKKKKLRGVKSRKCKKEKVYYFDPDVMSKLEGSKRSAEAGVSNATSMDSGVANTASMDCIVNNAASTESIVANTASKVSNTESEDSKIEVSKMDCIESEVAKSESIDSVVVNTEYKGSEVANTESKDPEIANTESKDPEIANTESKDPEIANTESKVPEIANTESKDSLVAYIDCEEFTIIAPEDIKRIEKRGPPKLKRKPHECTQCNFVTPIRKKLVKHVQVKHKLYNCDTCGYGTNLDYLFKHHMVKHSGLKIKCEICSATFKSHGKLNRHRIIHMATERYTCDQCGFTTIHGGNMKQHQMIHDNERPFKCNLCDFSTRYITSLRYHTMRHTGKKNLKCDKCDYRSQYPAGLRAHKASHSEIRPYACDICGYSAKIKHKLLEHIRRHNIAMLYKCSKCEYTTNVKYELTSHVSTHFTFNKPLSCGVCGFVAGSKVALVAHEKIHKPSRIKCVTSTPLYECDVCGFRCKIIQMLYIHKLSHTNADIKTKVDIVQNKFICGICSASYRSWAFFAKHRLAHRDDKD